MTEYPDSCLVLFARAPVVGRVKTRLIPALGAEGACALHQRLLARVLALLQQAPCAVELWVDGQPDHPAFAAFAGPLHLQMGADLGERLAGAAADVLQRFRQVLFIGADCPFLDEGYLRDALTALQAGSELVIGPASDGGYVLLGLARHEPALFRHIDWGGPEVLHQTLAQAASCGLEPVLLPTLPDIDRPADLALLPADFLSAGFLSAGSLSAGFLYTGQPPAERMPAGLVPASAGACGYNAALPAMSAPGHPSTLEHADD